MEDRHEQAAPATSSNINPELIPQATRLHAWPPAQPPAHASRMNGAPLLPQTQQDSQALRQPYYTQPNGHPQTVGAPVAAPRSHQQQQQHQQPPTQQHQQQPPTAQQSQHDYRAPAGQPILPSVSLPPIQQYKPAQDMTHQPPPPPSQYAPLNGDAHMAQPPPQPGPYGYAPNMMAPSGGQVIYGRDGYADRRYSPPALHPMPQYAPMVNGQVRLDPRQMSGGRHRKEIKRRTKTGCLTCRKRRIKCDERHPDCRNCEKSKRECLGYDPIFKQQSGPAQIQPAPMGPPPKEGELSMQYSQGSYQGMDDMYGATRPPPPSASAPPAPAYGQHPYGPPHAPQPLDTQPGHPPGNLQHYHPPFDPAQRPESKA